MTIERTASEFVIRFPFTANVKQMPGFDGLFVLQRIDSELQYRAIGNRCTCTVYQPELVATKPVKI